MIVTKRVAPLLLLMIISCCLTAQQSGIFEEKYEASNEDLPKWVKLMYTDNPNLREVESAYNEYYKNNKFVKTKYTQYYKRWKRDKWQYVDKDGFINIPSEKEALKNLETYLARNENNKNKKRANGSSWEELGPWEYDHEVTMDLRVQSPGSSHVWAMEQAQSDQDIVYAGTVNAGIWKSTDRGMSWDIVSAEYPIRGVYSLEIDHTNADIVYVHANGYIWKTIDGGSTWIKSGGDQYFNWARDIIMHPTDQAILLAATTNGLYRTADAGDTWIEVKGGHFQELEFHPTNVNIVYAVKQIANRTELYKSNDAGLTFTLKPDGWPGISGYATAPTFSSIELDDPTYAEFSNIDFGSSSMSDFTIDLRVKSSGWSGDPAIFSNKNWASGANKGIVIAANGSGWKFNIGDGSSRIDLNGGNINDGEWHHIAVTYSANGSKNVYQDGSLISSTTASISTSTISGLSLAMGQDGTTNYGFGFPGSVAEVRVWSDALSASAISDLSCSVVDQSHSNYSDLVHYWKLDEGSGSVIADTKGNNDGTIIGTSNWSTNNEMVCIESEFASGDENKRVEIAVTPHAPNSLYVLATGSADGGSGLYGFYKSTDQAESFDFVCCGNGPGGLATTNNPNIVGYAYDLTEGGGQYYYDLSLAVSPTDSNKIFAAGISVVRSEDGGQTWETNGHWVTWVGPNTTQRYTHADVHDVKFFTHGGEVSLWTASDGGLFYSANQGDNFEPRMHGIHGTEFWGFGGSYKEDAMIGGTYHNGTLVHYNDTYAKGKYGKGGWFAGAAADLTKGYVHEADGKRMFNEGGLFEIVSRDVYWNYLDFDNSKNANQIRPGRYGNYAWHPHYYEEYYSPRDSVLYKTTDNGKSWEVVHDFGDGRLYELKIPVSDPDVIYAIQNHENQGVLLWKTTDGGNAWVDVTPPDAVVNGNNWRDKLLDIDQDNPDNIWLLLSGNAGAHKVFSSTDGGINWTNITGSNLDGETMLDLVHHQGTQGGLYVGTTNSIYYRNDNMSDWVLYNEGLPLLTRSNYLYPYYTGGKIRMGTYRGAFERDFYENGNPTVRIGVDKRTADCSRDTFYFKDMSYVEHDGVSWLWTFEGGNPSTSTEENPKVVFSEGSHQVSLTVTNDYGSQTQVLDDLVMVSMSDCEKERIPGHSILTANNGYINLGRPTDLDFSNNKPFTFMGWIKLRENDMNGYIFSKYDRYVTGQYQFGIEYGKVMSLRETPPYTVTGTTSIEPENWYHVATTYDGAILSVYVDGMLEGQINSTGSINSIGRDILVGARHRSGSIDDHFKGEIEELSIWNRSLTQEEIRDIRHLTLDQVEDASLVAYYQFNEEGGRVYDRAQLNHGEISSVIRAISDAPLGGGNSSRKYVSTSGPINFDSTGVVIDFSPGTYPNGEVVVTRIDQLPNVNPSTAPTADSYWVINNYGQNISISSLSSLKFQDISINTPLAMANDYKLYQRSENENDAWTEVDNGDVYDSVNGTLTFSTNLNITNFGQYSLTNTKAKGWIGIVSTEWDNPNNWGGGVVPGLGDDVIIPPNTPYQPIVNIDTEINSLIMLNGSDIKVEVGKVLTIK